MQDGVEDVVPGLRHSDTDDMRDAATVTQAPEMVRPSKAKRLGGVDVRMQDVMPGPMPDAATVTQAPEMVRPSRAKRLCGVDDHMQDVMPCNATVTRALRDSGKKRRLADAAEALDEEEAFGEIAKMRLQGDATSGASAASVRAMWARRRLQADAAETRLKTRDSPGQEAAHSFQGQQTLPSSARQQGLETLRVLRKKLSEEQTKTYSPGEMPIQSNLPVPPLRSTEAPAYLEIKQGMQVLDDTAHIYVPNFLRG